MPVLAWGSGLHPQSRQGAATAVRECVREPSESRKHPIPTVAPASPTAYELAMLTRLLALAATLALTTAPSPDPLESQLTTLEKQSWVAWKARDGQFFQDFLSDDHVEVGNTGIATKQQVVAFVGSPICVVASYTVDHFRLTRFDDHTALLTYRAEQDTRCNGAPVPSPTWVSSLYVLRHGKWQNALYQHSSAEVSSP